MRTRSLSSAEHLHHPSSSSGEMLALPRPAKMGLYTVKFGNSVDGDVATVVLWACLR